MRRAPAREARPAKGSRPAARRGEPAPRLEASGARAGRSDREPEDEVLAVFRHYDRDRSGSIDAAELAALLEALGASPTEEELAVALDVVDRNHSGKISWAEFSAWWKAR